jgi:hypothetical protein
MNRLFQTKLNELAFGLKRAQPPSLVSLPNLPSLQYSQSIPTASTNGISSKLLIAFSILFTALLLLVVVHIFVTPIFPTSVTSAVPGLSDDTLYWKNDKEIAMIPESKLPINGRSSNYTFMLDFQIDYPTTTVGGPRIICHRGTEPCNMVNLLKNKTILTVVPNFNFVIYQDKDLNDVYISVLTKTTLDYKPPEPKTYNDDEEQAQETNQETNQEQTEGFENMETLTPETISINNFPVQKGIRIAVVLTTRFMEVYLNGLLYKTKTFTGPIVDTKGDIYPMPSQLRNATMAFGRIKNLRVWNRVLTVGEIKGYGAAEAFPNVMRAVDKPPPNSDNCPQPQTGPGKAVKELATQFEVDKTLTKLMEKTSSIVDTVTKDI